MIDEFSGLIKKIHSANKEIENELVSQNPMINKIDNRVDKTKNQIKNTTSRLDMYLQKSSNCCMFSFIAVEIMVVILLLLN
jgi:ferritin-like metal-binding protein YciE